VERRGRPGSHCRLSLGRSWDFWAKGGISGLRILGVSHPRPEGLRGDSDPYLFYAEAWSPAAGVPGWLSHLRTFTCETGLVLAPVCHMLL
jgi:hypothetical protein